MIILQYHEIPEIELQKDSNNRKYAGILLIRRTCTGSLKDRWFYFYFLYESYSFAHMIKTLLSVTERLKL